MKITKDNLADIHYYVPTHAFSRNELSTNPTLVEALLHDLDAVNNLLPESNKLYIDLEMKHTEYSPERTDPCPDYYGCFSLRWENEPSEKIGDYMTLNDLDSSLFLLTEFAEKVFSQHKA